MMVEMAPSIFSVDFSLSTLIMSWWFLLYVLYSLYRYVSIIYWLMGLH